MGYRVLGGGYWVSGIRNFNSVQHARRQMVRRIWTLSNICSKTVNVNVHVNVIANTNVHVNANVNENEHVNVNENESENVNGNGNKNVNGNET